MASTGGRTPRSSSRSKRSTTNLSDLRLAPLSTKFTEPAKERKTPRSPYEEGTEVLFSQNHSSYIQGKSAPSTPGILSRSSSRKHLGGGLSRRGSLYDDDVQYEYGATARMGSGSLRAIVGSGQIPKAKSETALLVQQRLSGQGVPLRKKHQRQGGIKTGTSTPRVKSRARFTDDDWLERTGAATSALLQEAKGQSWLASRDSSTTLRHLESDDDDVVDEGYEEMAALSRSQAELEGTLTPTASRVKSPMWGSRYGSRSASRRTSRRGSTTALRTPLAIPPGQRDMTGYFDGSLDEPTLEPDFVIHEPEDGEDSDEELTRLSDNRSYGLGSIVDRLMNFNLFSVPEREGDTTEEEDHGNRTDDEVSERREAEAKKTREERDRLAAPPPAPGSEGDEQAEGGWQDAAWLLSVASKALF